MERGRDLSLTASRAGAGAGGAGRRDLPLITPLLTAVPGRLRLVVEYQGPLKAKTLDMPYTLNLPFWGRFGIGAQLHDIYGDR